jgi:hypothetical protein
MKVSPCETRNKALPIKYSAAPVMGLLNTTNIQMKILFISAIELDEQVDSESGGR